MNNRYLEYAQLINIWKVLKNKSGGCVKLSFFVAICT